MKKKSFFKSYNILFSGFCTCLGDICAQVAFEKKPILSIDWRRTIRFTGIGALFIGPITHGGMKVFGNFWPSTATLYDNIVRTIAYLAMSPPIYAGAIGMIGWSQNLKRIQIEDKIIKETPQAFFGVFLVIIMQLLLAIF